MEIRPIKKSEWEKLKAFNAVEYKPGHILTDKVYYDWQFDNFANKDKESYSTLGLFNGEELLGTFGLFPAPYNFFGKTVPGVQLCNLIVKKNLRALGYGYLLMEKAAKLTDCAIDHTINETAWPIFMKAGWQGEDISRFVYIITPENDLYHAPISRGVDVPSGGMEFVSVESFDEAINVFWEEARKRYPVTVNRTAEYLNWRYAKNPFVKYPMFVAKQRGAIKGLVVIRFEEVKKEQPLGVKAARIIDFVATEDAEDFMLKNTVDFCRTQGADFIDYFSSGKFHGNALKKAGFASGDAVPYNEIPILFNPVSMKRTHLNFAVKAAQPTKLSDWYTTKGGGDQDRPY